MRERHYQNSYDKKGRRPITKANVLMSFGVLLLLPEALRTFFGVAIPSHPIWVWMLFIGELFIVVGYAWEMRVFEAIGKGKWLKKFAHITQTGGGVNGGRKG